MELELEKIKDNNLEKEQKNFLETTIGKVINTTLDIGLKYLLPDLIEDEVINIKNTLIKEGWEEGLKKTIEEGINLGKSAVGIFTGKFENIEQIKKAVGNGGIIDSASSLLDTVLDKATEKGFIKPSIEEIITKGKNILVQNFSTNIEDMLQKQTDLTSEIKESTDNWRTAYIKKDFSQMEKEFDKIESYIDKIVPLEKLINEVRKIENIHNIIKNNGGNFNLTENQLELANILIK